MATSLFRKRPLAMLTAASLLSLSVSGVIWLPFIATKMAIWSLIVRLTSLSGLIPIR